MRYRRGRRRSFGRRSFGRRRRFGRGGRRGVAALRLRIGNRM